MAYAEEKDLIQNIKDLRDSVEQMTAEFSTVQPSIDQILSLKSQFEDLANSTTAVIRIYENTLAAKNSEYTDLLNNCKSQFNQVTREVESLVALGLNFNEIKDKIEQCLELSDQVNYLVQDQFVIMKEGHYIDIPNRIPYKHYLKVIDSFDISAGGGSGGGDTTHYIVSPTLAISYTAR